MTPRELIVASLNDQDENTAFRTTARDGSEANAWLSRTGHTFDPETSTQRNGYVLRLDGYEDLHLAPSALVAFGERFALVRSEDAMFDACHVVETFQYRMGLAYHAWEALPDDREGLVRIAQRREGEDSERCVRYRIVRLPMVTTRMRVGIVQETADATPLRMAVVWADRWEDALTVFEATGKLPEDAIARVSGGGPDDDEGDNQPGM